jgi:hypothetical protein
MSSVIESEIVTDNHSLNDEIDDEQDNLDVEEAIKIDKIPINGSHGTFTTGLNISGVATPQEFKLGKIVK